MKIDDNLNKAAQAALAGKSKLADKSKKANKGSTPLASKQESSPEPSAPVKAKSAKERTDMYESQKTKTGAAGEVSVPVRPDKVERARQLVASGAYNNPDVIDKIIDRLIEAIREV